jgi:hypothetical protein
MYRLRRLAVDFPLRHGNPLKNRERMRLDKLRQFTVFDQFADLLMVATRAMVVVVMAGDFGTMIMVGQMSVLMMVMMFVAVLMLVPMFMLMMLVGMLMFV